MRCLIVSFLGIMVMSLSVSAQGWRGIVPLRSDCVAVKRILQIERCGSGTYRTPDGSVTIAFSDGTCESGWNVPSGTVLSLYVHERTQQELSKAAVDLTKYVKSINSHVRSITYYENKEEGVSIAVSEEGRIESTFYGPSSRDSSLRCSFNATNEVALPLTSTKFDEFGILGAKEEELRVKNLLTELNVWTSDAYVVAYTGRRDGIDGLSRAARIRAYLVKHGITKDRIVVMDGGLREESTIELYLILKPRRKP